MQLLILKLLLPFALLLKMWALLLLLWLLHQLLLLRSLAATAENNLLYIYIYTESLS